MDEGKCHSVINMENHFCALLKEQVINLCKKIKVKSTNETVLTEIF